jgi:hypothetical protein
VSVGISVGSGLRSDYLPAMHFLAVALHEVAVVRIYLVASVATVDAIPCSILRADPIATSAAIDLVFAALAVEVVSARAPVEVVVSLVALDVVYAALTEEMVVTVAAVRGLVRAAASVDVVASALAADVAVSALADDGLWLVGADASAGPLAVDRLRRAAPRGTPKRPRKTPKSSTYSRCFAVSARSTRAGSTARSRSCVRGSTPSALAPRLPQPAPGFLVA